jgi:hypothetical protein
MEDQRPYVLNGNVYDIFGLRRSRKVAREDFACILGELDFLKIQVSWLPARAWLSRMAWIGFGSV